MQELAGPNSICWASNGRLADMAGGCSEGTVKRIKRQLIAAGWLVPAGWRRNMRAYTVLWVSPMIHKGNGKIGGKTDRTVYDEYFERLAMGAKNDT